MIKLTLISIILSLSPLLTKSQYSEDNSGYQPQHFPLKTNWTDKIGTNPWIEYPRPQQVRKDWKSLNGIWRYQRANGSEDINNLPKNVDENWGKAVMIPSCIESGLSGIQANYTNKDNEFSWFQTKFEVPKDWSGQSLLINFGAIDYDATVYINGNNATRHKGGFTRFDAEISSLVKYGEQNEIVIFVHDPTDSEKYVVPVGKQSNDPSHIFYTPCSGIWQSVFIEPVPKTYIRRIDLSGDMHGVGTINVHTSDSSTAPVKISISDSAGTAYESNGETESSFNFTLPDVKLWSPDSPTLYNVTVSMGDDIVNTYTGFRSLEKQKVNGTNRPLINGEFVFTFGTLDQGYWPDGLYTPPSYEAMVYDLKFLKDLGMNMVRKHIKVETDLFYRACDELGLLVIQDMPSTTARKEFLPNEAQQAQHLHELNELVTLHKSFPSIFTWVIYNEAWGQPEDPVELEYAKMLKEWDPTRLVDATSGWRYNGAGDYSDNHHYPDPQCGMTYADAPSGPYDPNKIGFQGEFGGLGYNVTIDHLWNMPKSIRDINQTYEIDETLEKWNARSRDLLDQLQSQITNHACSGAVWTQTVDVEGEINGLMTYDRNFVRIDELIWRDAIQKLFKAAEERGAGIGDGSKAAITSSLIDNSTSTETDSDPLSQTNVATGGTSEKNETRENGGLRGVQIPFMSLLIIATSSSVLFF